MKLEDQVSSLELSKKLKTLGVKQDGQFYWVDDVLMFAQEVQWNMSNPVFYAPTVAELGEMLPRHAGEKSFPFSVARFKTPGVQWRVGYWINGSQDFRLNMWADGSTEADARAKMLIHLIEKGIVKP